MRNSRTWRAVTDELGVVLGPDHTDYSAQTAGVGRGVGGVLEVAGGTSFEGECLGLRRSQLERLRSGHSQVNAPVSATGVGPVAARIASPAAA